MPYKMLVGFAWIVKATRSEGEFNSRTVRGFPNMSTCKHGLILYCIKLFPEVSGNVFGTVWRTEFPTRLKASQYPF